jgi:hypothetical protein
MGAPQLSEGRLRYASSVTDRDRHPFLNQLSGTFTPTSKEWSIRADQWIQTYYQFRDGKLFLVENDNKEQTNNEREVDIAGFLSQHATTSESPYPEMVAFLASVKLES